MSEATKDPDSELERIIEILSGAGLYEKALLEAYDRQQTTLGRLRTKVAKLIRRRRFVLMRLRRRWLLVRDALGIPKPLSEWPPNARANAKAREQAKKRLFNKDGTFRPWVLEALRGIQPNPGCGMPLLNAQIRRRAQLRQAQETENQKHGK